MCPLRLEVSGSINHEGNRSPALGRRPFPGLHGSWAESFRWQTCPAGPLPVQALVREGAQGAQALARVVLLQGRRGGKQVLRAVLQVLTVASGTTGRSKQVRPGQPGAPIASTKTGRKVCLGATATATPAEGAPVEAQDSPAASCPQEATERKAPSSQGPRARPARN